MIVCKVKCIVVTTLKVPRMFGKPQHKVFADTKWLTRVEAQSLVKCGHKVHVPVQKVAEERAKDNTVMKMQGTYNYYCALYFKDELELLPSTWP